MNWYPSVPACSSILSPSLGTTSLFFPSGSTPTLSVMDSDVVAGQFEDADEFLPSQHTPTAHQGYRDECVVASRSDDEADSWSSDEDVVGDDWDWHGTSGDFTKQWKAKQSGVQPNAQSRSASNPKMQPTSHALRKFSDKVHVEAYAGPKLPGQTTNKLVEGRKRTEAERVRVKDKADRATLEQVLDPRTRMILFRFLNFGVVQTINGCISTGKEANVYHATTAADGDYAVKIYKTSILTFKDRDKYVTGEFRYRHGYSRHNPRKMVKVWAEKEMRNLSRLTSAGVPCPKPIILRRHVLVMTFLGQEGWPAPRVKDVELSESKWRELYLQCVQLMHTIYHRCKLVHADLSEFNMLYHQHQLFIIDVSQSVEHDHPHAMDFLRKDCLNVTEFFRKKAVNVMPDTELVRFVTNEDINEGNVDEYLEEAQKRIALQPTQEPQQEDGDVKQVDDVQESKSPEKDAKAPEPAETVCEESSSEGSEDDDDDEEEGEEEGEARGNRRKDDDDSDQLSRKERKKAAKEEQREKRKNKVPKHVKKRKQKVAAQQKHGRR